MENNHVQWTKSKVSIAIFLSYLKLNYQTVSFSDCKIVNPRHPDALAAYAIFVPPFLMATVAHPGLAQNENQDSDHP